MEVENQYRYLIGGYYGIQSMDNYDLKVYILKDIENYIRFFVEQNPLLDFNYQEEAQKVEKASSLITKLQDSLLVLNKIDAPMELVLLVKAKLKHIKEEERHNQ